METPEYDVVISGAGPVGSALALLLAHYARTPERIALLQKQGTGNSSAPTDPRTLAMNHGSRALLEPLGAWPALSADITTVHVSQHRRLGRTLISHEELDVPRLGSVVAYSGLQEALQQALEQSRISVLAAGEHKPGDSEQHWLTADAQVVRGRLRVRSDGSPPTGVRRDYGQHAVLATIQVERPRAGWAFERFTRQGPLAVLPHPAGTPHYALVWCCSPDRASQLQRLDETSFAQALQQAFGDRLGRIHLSSDRHVFPLALNAGPLLLDSRTVAVGNAAQTLHPVAGQGLNLGLRDAAQLAFDLRDWLNDPAGDPAPLLQKFARHRRPDRLLTSAITDFLPRIFATGVPLVEHACGLSLLAMDTCRPLRMPLARHLLEGLRT